jgi:ribosomal-protein-alanine N-acetyltransferase
MVARLPFPVLETARLRLRRIVPEDAPEVLALFADPAVVEFYDLAPLRGPGEADRLVELWNARWEAGTGIRWALTEAASGVFLGTAGFNVWSPAMRTGSIGYDLVPSAWGRGYASEAVAAMVAAAFAGTLPCGPLHRIQADVMPANDRSRRTLERLGFRLEGIRRGAGYWKGQHHDLACFVLLATDVSPPPGTPPA